MKKVEKAKVEQVVEPEHGDGGEEVLGKAEHGQGNDAAHDEGEQGPVVEQGRVLPDRQQVLSAPIIFFKILIDSSTPSTFHNFDLYRYYICMGKYQWKISPAQGTPLPLMWS